MLHVHHVFILTEANAPVGEALVDFGLRESPGRVHQGQGTANRRFEFEDGMLELLWVHDSEEATTGAGASLRFSERVGSAKSCPFGIIFSSTDGAENSPPFPCWQYQPDYFPESMAFDVGSNSDVLTEPLCIYAPFFSTAEKREVTGTIVAEAADYVSGIKLCIATDRKLSEPLRVASAVEGLTIQTGDEYLLEITLNDNASGVHKDFRPGLPLIVCR